MSRKKTGIYRGYIPMNYQGINMIEGSYTPSMMKTSNNLTFAYWERALFQRATSIVDFELPEEWQGDTRDFFYYCLFKFGYLGIFDSKEHGFTFQPGTLSGQGWYYQFTKFMVANPTEDSDQFNEMEIGKDVEVLKLTPDYQGIWDTISYHAQKLASLDTSIDMSIANTRISRILGAKTKAAAEALRKVMDMVTRGEPLVIADYLLANDMKDKDSPFQVFEAANLKAEAGILTEQMQNFQSLINRFDAEIGIPVTPYQKAERMVSSEATMRIMDGTSRSETWKQTVDSSLKVINKHYGDIFTIKANWRFDADKILTEGGNENVISKDNNDRM